MFMEAVIKGRIATAELLVKQGVDPKKVKGIQPPLIAALCYGQKEMARSLLHWGVDLEARDDLTGRAALHYGSISLGITELLVKAGANVNVQDNEGETLLMILCRKVGAAKEAAKLLLDSGANPDIRDKNGKTAFFRAVTSCNLDMAKILLEAGADPDIRNNNGRLPEEISPYDRVREEVAKMKKDLLEQELSVFKNGLSRPLRAAKPLKPKGP
jgi:ankyrin repeat protein